MKQCWANTDPEIENINALEISGVRGILTSVAVQTKAALIAADPASVHTAAPKTSAPHRCWNERHHHAPGFKTTNLWLRLYI